MWNMDSYTISSTYPAVLLAGGNLGSEPKAFVNLLGKPMIWYFLSAFNDVRDIFSPVALVTPKERWGELEELLKSFDLDLALSEPGKDPMDSLVRGLKLLVRDYSIPDDSFLWAFATDTPLVEGDMIRDVVYRADMLRDEADLFYVVVSKEPYLGRFPDSRRTFLSLRRGSFCGTGVVGFRISILERLGKIGETLVRNRKSPLAMASFLGFDLTLGVVLRSYTLLDLEEKISDRFGIRGKVLLSEYPELAFNVDDISEIRLAEKYLGEGESADD